MKPIFLLSSVLFLWNTSTYSQCNISIAGNAIAQFSTTCNNLQITGIIDDDISFGAQCGDYTFIPPIADPENNTVSIYSSRHYNLRVFPNPTHGIINFISTDFELNNYVVVYDIMGRIVKRQLVLSSRVTIDLTDQPNGVYLIMSEGKQPKVFTAKIVKTD